MAVGWGLSVNLAAYHRARSVGHQPFVSACYAPYVGLSFDVHGMVSVCAFTRSTPLGQVGEHSLLDLWNSEPLAEIRAAVRADDLERWCSRCAEEIAGGNVHGVLAEGFDRFRVDPAMAGPTRLEFALSNACNLQCVMCSGEYSSAIRSHREGLPPLPARYGETFLEELAPFLPGLAQARFLGGEPFLAEVNFRIWELMIEVGSTAECNVTTNGTQWSPRMAAILEQLPFSIGVSIDGVRRQTVESIRSGASYDRIMSNLEQFLAYRERTGASISLTFCLMVENWQEFGEYLQFAEARGCRVFVNTVRQPPRHSLYHLPLETLRGVVDDLERARDEVAVNLDLNRDAWTEQIDRLSVHLAERSTGGESAKALEADVCSGDELMLRLADPRRDEGDLLTELAAVAHDGVVSRLRCDVSDTIVEGDRYLGIEVAPLIGRPATQLMSVLADRLGHRADVLSEAVVHGATARVVSFGEPGGRPTVLATVVRRGPRPHGTTRMAAILRPGRRAAPGSNVRFPVRSSRGR